MKKAWFLGLLSQVVWGQYVQDFESESTPVGWSTYVEGVGSWEFGNNVPPFYLDPIFASGVALFDDGIWGGQARAATAYLLSPVFVNAQDERVNLAFDYYLNTYGEWGTLRVDLNFGSGWVTYFVANDDQVTMRTVWIDAPVKAGMAVQVRFVFTDNGGWSWGTAIDNFRLHFVRRTDLRYR